MKRQTWKCSEEDMLVSIQGALLALQQPRKMFQAPPCPASLAIALLYRIKELITCPEMAVHPWERCNVSNGEFIVGQPLLALQ